MNNYTNQYYPEIEPYNSFMLKVSDIHELYVEECGNPKGKPVVYLHGGPGGGCSPKQRRYFDPKKYRIILFDQRGCGRSKPFASIEQNSTRELTEDIEKIRKHLKIEKWQVAGGSWGCYLALIYAEEFPERVTEIIVRGVFMATQREHDWLYVFGASEIFYQDWLNFVEWLPVEERKNLVQSYHRRLNHKDPKICLEAANKWNEWEMNILSLYKDESNVTEAGENLLAFSRIECHYAVEKFFNENDRVIRNIGKIKNIPGVIIHGQYDIVCAARNAYELKKLWPKADLRIVPDAGHSGSEPGIVHEIIAATNLFAK